ncbi:hypothetical protein [Lignipirellula cremea]|uniref:Uncharacterized protein n=1 Tax=Lignipirellula cremea TaxID=2528010 RepID=A0A518DSX8_9BACT|nr:hypothetical protein [Lignipirellula cremea]QDU94945.1 hypothetical protein Pla8534_27530 [Lignipirellula cremea]
MFPTMADQFMQLGLIVFASIFTLMLGSGFLFYWRTHRREASPVILVIGVFCLLFSCLMGCEGGSGLLLGMRFRAQLRPGNIEKIVIRKIEEEGDLPGGTMVAIDDPATIDATVSTLEQVTVRYRNHEAYGVGYQVEFLPKNGQRSLYLLVFERDIDQILVNVVVPVAGPAERNSHSEFACPGLVATIANHWEAAHPEP